MQKIKEPKKLLQTNKTVAKILVRFCFGFITKNPKISVRFLVAIGMHQIDLIEPKYIIIYVRAQFDSQAQRMDELRPNEPNTMNL